jgi:hypothetical protein
MDYSALRDPDAVSESIAMVWKDRSAIRQGLVRSLPAAQASALRNFAVLAETAAR